MFLVTCNVLCNFINVRVSPENALHEREFLAGRSSDVIDKRSAAAVVAAAVDAVVVVGSRVFVLWINSKV